jgi:hypothetical protein
MDEVVATADVCKELGINLRQLHYLITDLGIELRRRGRLVGLGAADIERVRRSLPPDYGSPGLGGSAVPRGPVPSNPAGGAENE